MKCLGATVFGSYIALASSALGSDSCSGLVGTAISPVSIDAIIQKVSKLPSQKGEFETSEAFAARSQAAKATLADSFTVAIPFDPKYAVYNADAGRFDIQSYALDNANTSYDGVFGYGTPLYEKVKYSSLNNLDIVFQGKDMASGAYRGSNAFGASTTVVRVKRLSKAIFDRDAEFGEDLFFGPKPYDPMTFGQPQPEPIIFQISATPSTARILKSTLKAAVIIAPKEPFFAVGKVTYGPPTIDNPRDISEMLEVVVADISCALVTDNHNAVLGARPTR